MKCPSVLVELQIICASVPAARVVFNADFRTLRFMHPWQVLGHRNLPRSDTPSAYESLLDSVEAAHSEPKKSSRRSERKRDGLQGRRTVEQSVTSVEERARGSLNVAILSAWNRQSTRVLSTFFTIDRNRSEPVCRFCPVRQTGPSVAAH